MGVRAAKYREREEIEVAVKDEVAEFIVVVVEADHSPIRVAGRSDRD